MSPRGQLAGMAVAVTALLAPPAAAFDCVETRCPEITSCAEAAYKLLVCGHGKRDADGDGIPCESLCGDDPEVFRKRVAAQWPEGLLGAAPSPQAAVVADSAPPAAAASDFVCGTKRSCKQMVSCEEARYHLTICGVRTLDGDRDGVPCNSLCRGR